MLCAAQCVVSHVLCAAAVGQRMVVHGSPLHASVFQLNLEEMECSPERAPERGWVLQSLLHSRVSRQCCLPLS